MQAMFEFLGMITGSTGLVVNGGVKCGAQVNLYWDGWAFHTIANITTGTASGWAWHNEAAPPYCPNGNGN
jgi:hypothetical protein